MRDATDEPRTREQTLVKEKGDRSPLSAEAKLLLQRLIGCDTSNPPGREVQAVALLEAYLEDAGVEGVRVAKDPERPNLVARLRGTGEGPSLAFLGHLDVVPARRQDWSVDPFGGIERDGAIWGRGSVDMKSQVAATAVALATLAREGFRPRGDLMVLLAADEEVGSAGVGTPFLLEERPDLSPDYLVGEGGGERYETPTGPIYLLDHGVKCTASVTLTVHGKAADASLPRNNQRNAAFELATLLARLANSEMTRHVLPEVEPLLRSVAPDAADGELVERAMQANDDLAAVIDALTTNVVPPTVVDSSGPANAVREEATITLQCAALPRTAPEDLEREIREALGPGDYNLDVSSIQGGLISPTDTPLRHAIETFLAAHDSESRLVPTLGYGFSDCHYFREERDTVAYGFIPFRHAKPGDNLGTKHGVDERVLVADLDFQVAAALAISRSVTGDGASNGAPDNNAHSSLG